ncbi:MAG: hypothetical protein ACREVL_07600 [Solimonas sp.]
MAVKRDYGSFAKATDRLLPALIRPQGYEPAGNGFFARRREGWLEGFGLQQSQFGGGEFRINMGIHVPALRERWLKADDGVHGLSIAFRLSADGADQGDAWLPAANRSELERSLATLVSWLPLAEPWFRQFRSLSDVARIYRERSNLVAPGGNEHHLRIMAASYGFLLAEAGDSTEARLWLQEAARLMSLPVYDLPDGGMAHEKLKGARLQKPSADGVRQLDAVRRSLAGLLA